jgi:hypothetical protein
MQLQALIRAAVGRPLDVMFPFITEMTEFQAAREDADGELHREQSLGHHALPDIRGSARCWKRRRWPCAEGVLRDDRFHLGRRQ